jgi:peptidoglycan/xylan/chitin deacetylase (PgdA/CDA1 family)
MKAIHNQVTSLGSLVEGFENVGDWTVHGTGCSVQTSTISKTGNSSLKHNIAAGIYSYAEKVINKNFNTVKNFTLWLYVSDITKLQYIILYFSSDSNVTKDVKFSIDAKYLLTGWNYLVFAKSLWTLEFGELWSNTMNYMNVTAAASQDMYLLWDDLRSDYTARPKVIYAFDDGYDNQRTNAVPTMTSNSQLGNFFIPHINIGQSSWGITLDNMHVLDAAGHDIANHTWDHPVDLTALSDSDMHAEIDQMDNYLVTNGFTRYKYFSIPYSAYGQREIDYLYSKGYKYSYNDVYGIYNPHLIIDSNRLNLQARAVEISAENNTTPTVVQGYIDNLIDQQGLLILNFHQIVDSGATLTSYNVTDFITISNYLKTKSDAGLLDVVTLTNYFNGYDDPLVISPMTNIQWINNLLKESGLSDTNIKEFLTIIYNSLSKNQDVESNISYTNSNYLNYFSSISDQIETLTTQDLLELSNYI